MFSLEKAPSAYLSICSISIARVALSAPSACDAVLVFDCLLDGFHFLLDRQRLANLQPQKRYRVSGARASDHTLTLLFKVPAGDQTLTPSQPCREGIFIINLLVPFTTNQLCRLIDLQKGRPAGEHSRAPRRRRLSHSHSSNRTITSHTSHTNPRGSVYRIKRRVPPDNCCGLLANKVTIEVVGDTMLTLFPCVFFMLHMKCSQNSSLFYYPGYNLLAFEVIRLGVAAKAGASCCLADRLMHKIYGTKCTGPKHIDV